MNYEQTKNSLGGFVSDVEVAKSFQSRKEVINRIITYIKEQGLDVDDAYINFINNYKLDNVPVKVSYLPVYYVTSIARLYWKEKDETKSEHQEFIKFETCFYANEKNKDSRLNNLNALGIIDKEVLKRTSKTTSLLAIENNSLDEDVKLLGTNQEFERQIIMDTPLEGEDDIYPLELNYILSEKEIDDHLDNALKNTKSYQRLSKFDEKVSKIEQKRVEVVLVPIGKIELGKHEQYVNCVNGMVDVRYEKSRQISKNLKHARLMVFPSIILFALCSAISFVFKWNVPTSWNVIPHLLNNIIDVLWLFFTLCGVIISLFAIPKREKIVARATANKDRLKINRNLAKFLIEISLVLIVLMLISIFLPGQN